MVLARDCVPQHAEQFQRQLWPLAIQGHGPIMAVCGCNEDKGSGKPAPSAPSNVAINGVNLFTRGIIIREYEEDNTYPIKWIDRCS